MSIAPKVKISRVADSLADSKAPGGGRLADEQAFSLDAEEVDKLAAQVNSLPEVRREKVAAIKSALREGNYQVSPNQIAEALISGLQARPGLGGPAGKEGNEMADADTGGRVPTAGVSEPPAQQFPREFGSRATHDVAAEPASCDDEPREDSETSHNQMDSVA